MNTHQLQCAIHSDPHMRYSIYGVFASDEINSIHLRPGTGFIANTDDASQSGKHWIAFYYNDNNVLELFDSYGNTLQTLFKYFKTFLSRYPKTNLNTQRLQSNDSIVCGQYCLFFLFCRVRLLSMKRILNIFSFNQYVNDQFVYQFIEDRFYCCVNPNDKRVLCQACIKCTSL